MAILTHTIGTLTFWIITSFIYNHLLAFIPLSVVCIIIILFNIVSKFQTSQIRNENLYNAEGDALAEDALSNIYNVKVFDGTKVEIDKYRLLQENARRAVMKQSLMSAISSGLFMLLHVLALVLGSWYEARNVLEHRHLQESRHDVTTYFVLMNTILFSSLHVRQIIPQFDTLFRVKVSASRIWSIIDRVSLIDSRNKCGKKLTDLRGDIEFKNVSFNYSSRQEVKIFESLSLTIKSGETTAIVGESGCGKSTLVQLVQRCYDPSEGMVEIDGQDIKSLNLQWLREQIGAVLQEPMLFGMTIRENISCGRITATQDDIEKAAKQAFVHNFIMQLPNKYDTLVGNHGEQLSGGQKQRIAIARAILRKPKILVLDEATSALDSQTENEVLKSVIQHSKNQTTIIVAHRLSTIVNADRIILMSQGNVIESGNHEQLMAMHGSYYDLFKLQCLKENAPVGTERNVNNPNQGEESLHNNLENRLIHPSEHTQTTVSSHDSSLEKPQLTQGSIFNYFRPVGLHIAMAFLASCAIACNIPMAFIVVSAIIETFINCKDDDAMKEASFNTEMLIVLGISMAIAAFIQGFLLPYSAEYIHRMLKNGTFDYILHKDISWFDNTTNNVSHLCHKISNLTSDIKMFVMLLFGVHLKITFAIVVFYIMFFTINWKFSLALVLCSLLHLSPGYILKKITTAQYKLDEICSEKINNVLVDVASNIRDAIYAEEMFQEEYLKSLKEVRKRGHFCNVLKRSCIIGWNFAFVMAYTCILYVFGMYLVMTENVQISTILKILCVMVTLSMEGEQTLAWLPNVTKAFHSIQEIHCLLEHKPRVTSVTEFMINPKQGNGTIEFINVCFSYGHRQEQRTLNNFNLSITPNQKVALVGQSGCGKSTCLHLLKKLYDPETGTMAFDQHDYKTLSGQWLRSHMAVVPQEPKLFNRTIAENIAYGANSRTATMEEIIEASKEANIHDVIISLPQGYDTLVGKFGVQLSGGQKQRVGIARALIRQPKILLLDEATSAMDANTEKAFHEILDKYESIKTCIIVAHRLSTIQNADVIAVVNQGTVVELGNHSDLMSQKGLYYNYYLSQS